MKYLNPLISSSSAKKLFFYKVIDITTVKPFITTPLFIHAIAV